MISVIVTIYNVSKYLTRCIESIINQTHGDIEIILVDDGSTDGSEKICDEYAKIDARITVIHKKNEGLVNARKTGLQKSCGDFILYVDGDDYIEAKWIEVLFDKIMSTDADVIEAGYFIDIDNNSYPVYSIMPEGIYETCEIANRLLSDYDTNEASISPFLWSKLWKRNILFEHQMRADDRIRIAEDVVVTYPALFSCKKICVANVRGYHYVQHKKSMTNSYEEDEMEGINLVVRFLKDTCSDFPNNYDIKNQIDRFERLQLLTRTHKLFESVLPINEEDIQTKVIIYGAGHLGRNFYNYLSGREDVRVCAIVDKNYERYENEPYTVESTDDLAKRIIETDYVIVAVMNKKSVCSIVEFLIDTGYKKEQIICF